MVRLERLDQFKNPITSSGIQPATSQNKYEGDCGEKSSELNDI
jgi:hypothetical protein